MLLLTEWARVDHDASSDMPTGMSTLRSRVSSRAPHGLYLRRRTLVFQVVMAFDVAFSLTDERLFVGVKRGPRHQLSAGLRRPEVSPNRVWNLPV